METDVSGHFAPMNDPGMQLLNEYRAGSGVPHMLKEGKHVAPCLVARHTLTFTADDEYAGYFLPKGSLVFIPIWALHHSEAEYSDHERFNPDRFEGYDRLANDYAGSSDFAKRDHYGFGAGRRLCPGVHLAERNMWRIAAKLLWAFEFSEPVDPETGAVRPIDDEDYYAGILQAPNPFKVVIKPRSAEHVRVIKAEMADALGFLEQFDE